MNPDWMLSLKIPAQADKLCLVRTLVKRAAELAGCEQALVEKMVIAVNEACMNVIQHAYKEDESGEIILEIHNNDGNLVFDMRDHAKPIDIDSVKPRDLEDIRPGGLGTHFIWEIMDECKIGHLEGGAGNYFKMIKKIS